MLPFRNRLRRLLDSCSGHPLWLAASLAVLLPLAGLDGYVLHVLTLVFIYMTLSSGLNLLTGLTGLVDLGYVAFFAVGAYSYALLEPLTGLPFPLLLIPIVAITLIWGVFLGLPTLRVRGDYLAIVTLGFGELVHLVAINWDALSGGPEGIANVAPPHFGLFRVDSALGFYYLALLFLVGSVVFAHRLAISRIGWAWMAIRGSEDLARALGHQTVQLKLLAFCAAASVGGVTGALFAAFQSFVSPGSFVFFESVMVLTMVVLGGGIHGNLAGVLLAAFALSVLPEVFREFEGWRLPLYGLAMAAMALYRERGLIGSDWTASSLGRAEARSTGATGDEPLRRLPPCHLDVRGLGKRFGGVDALRQFSFRFEAHGIYGVIGHNGAGKTTLVNVLTGVMDATSGEYEFVDAGDGRRWGRLVAARTFQRLNLLDHLDAVANVYAACAPMRGSQLLRELLSALGFGVLAREQRADLARSRSALKLADFPVGELSKPVGTLPFGLRRQVELARALVTESPVIFLDEPFSGLADDERNHLRERLRRIGAETGRLIVIVEHQYRYLEPICNQLIYMEAGSIYQEHGGAPLVGTPAVVLQHPRVVANYLGESLQRKQHSPRESRTLLVIDRLAAAYGNGGEVLRDITLKIHMGEVGILAGLNGAGKTTLLRSIMGAGGLRMTRGEMWFGGQSLEPLAAHERAARGIVLVPQELRVFSSLSVDEHFRLLTGEDLGRLAVRFGTLLERVPVLMEKRRVLAGHLSGGQQQTLAVVSALIKLCGSRTELSLLLMDEPTTGLQPNLAQVVLELVADFTRSSGMAVLVAEQDPRAFEIADQVWRIHGGRLVQQSLG